VGVECVWSAWLGGCGGLEKAGGEDGCWLLKRSGGSTLRLMLFGLVRESACDIGECVC
jgi:hypothetical protein